MARPRWSLSPSARWKRLARTGLKLALGVLVLGAVGRQVVRTWNDLQAHGEAVHVDPGWAAAGGVLYLAGLSGCGVFYGRVMGASATPIAAPAAWRAYLISHLGKYVPGKAMVVVMRVALSSPYGARPATAAIATFYETLVMMAAGAVVAAVGFATARPVPWTFLLASAGLAVAFLVVVSPWVFPSASRRVASPIPGVGPDDQPKLSWPLLGTGLAWSTACWILLGLSQVAVVRAVAPEGVPPSLWPVVTASVALATVGGFVVAVLPGGLGVREWLLMTALGPALRRDTAVVAALLLRLVWVVAEVIAGGVLAVARPAPHAPKPATVTTETPAIGPGVDTPRPSGPP